MTVSQAITLVFPHQLYQNNPAVNKNRLIVMVEEFLFFNHYNFHKQKLVLHRASMKFYQQHLKNEGHQIMYVEAVAGKNHVANVVDALKKQKVDTIHVVNAEDYWLQTRLQKACKKAAIRLVEYNSPNFLNTVTGTDQFFNNRKTYFQTDFYTWQRKSKGILLTANGQPEGGKWTYDSENREPLKKGVAIAKINFVKDNTYVTEAKQYVNKHFSKNYGPAEIESNNGQAFFPTTFAEAEQWMDTFFEQRFQQFGKYEDALHINEQYLFHSLLSPMLNIGLLNPQQVVAKALDAAPQYHVPLNSLEGFIRQIIGWREFIRIVYAREGHTQRTKNYWGFTRKIPASFWNATTGIVPVDNVIEKVLKVGYSHHIERLMVMGNFMLLCEFDPNDVFKWFMEMYVDAYDWVMVPNTYGMTQFADGGLMTTKPYISGSNYLMKMGNYPKGDWQPIWDGLFWRFMHVHRDFFGKNPRLGMLLKTFDKMPKEKQDLHINNAEQFLQKLDR